MNSKPGRKRGRLRGEYAEVRELASVLRDIADSHGLTLRDLEEGMPYSRTTISERLSGGDRPEWKFVTSFLRACTGDDRQACVVLERKARLLWEAAAPSHAHYLAPAPVDRLPADVGAWVATMRETAAAQQVVARLQLSVSRNMGTVQGLAVMLEKLTSAARTLTEERDAFRRELLKNSDTAAELLHTRALLDDTQGRLEAAELLLSQTSRRLDEALRQRKEAESLKEIAIRQAQAAQRRLAEIEQHAIAFADHVRAEVHPAASDTTLMDGMDQQLAAEILSRVDDTLDAEASTLDQLHGELASASADKEALSGGQLPADANDPIRASTLSGTVDTHSSGDRPSAAQRVSPQDEVDMVPHARHGIGEQAVSARRRGLATVGRDNPGSGSQKIPGRINPASLQVSELWQAMASGRLTSEGLTRYYLKRIEELNPALHAIIAVSPDALADAAVSDQAWSSGRPRGPLEGIPVLVKDNIQAAGMPTTAGSPALASAQMPDAFIVSRLRAAGAVILAKANLSEWANFRSIHSCSGWSTLGGQTANPYVLDRNPSGSSSGSAAGVSAGLAPLAVGTETDGSIVSPSSACGVVGIKPTLGLISRTGIVPLSPVQDTAGPIAASVADAAALLSVLAAPDPQDPATDIPSHVLERTSGKTDYTQFLDPDAIEGARIGIWRTNSFEADQSTVAILNEAAKQLRSMGAHIIDPVDLPNVEKIKVPEFDALYYEFKYGINAYLTRAAANSKTTLHVPGSLTELIEFNQRNADTVLARFGQEIFEAANATSGDLTDPAYLERRNDATRLAVLALQTPVQEHNLNAVVSLTANPAWVNDYILGDHSKFGNSRPAAVSGWPAISVPCGYVSGLPVGITFAGPRWSEPRLIALAYAFEQAAMARGQPSFLRTLGT